MDPVAFSIFGLKVYWYGLMWIAAAVQFYFVGRSLGGPIVAPRPVGRVVENMLFACMLGSLIGGRVGYALFYGWDQLVESPLWIFQIWQGGMSFHGGLLGVVAGVLYVAHSEKVAALRIGDLACLGAPLGLAFGRLGNFINGELWGKPTLLPWGMVFQQADELPRHPSQFYELLGEGILLFLVLTYLAKRHYHPGLLVAVFLIGYGLIRFLVEFVREPDAHIGYFNVGGILLSMGQLLSLPMMAIGLWLLASLERPKG